MVTRPALPVQQACRWLAPAGILLLVGVLATWRLAVQPPPWYDEGVNLQAARNLAHSGRYGLVYSEQLRPFDLQLTTGPTVIAPVALAFKAFGVGLVQGRAVMVVYTLLAAVGLYRAGRLLYGPTVAALAVLVLCASGSAGPVATRDVVGEVAALAYLFWGVATLATARAASRGAHDAAAGLLFGLAVLTKGQFALLVPSLIGAWLLTRGQPGGFPARRLAVVLAALTAPAALWQLHQVVVLGTTGFVEHLRDQSAALSVSAGVPPLSRTRVGVLTLLSSLAGALSLVGLGYAWLAALRRGWRREPAERLLAPTFATAWLVWYLGFSIGYARYTVPFIATCTPFVAVLLRDLVVGFRPPRGVGGPTRPALVASVPRAAAAVVLTAVIASGIAARLRTLVEPPDTAAQQMAAIITREVEPGASTESLEWELDVLAPRPFHHPPPFVPAVPYEVPATTAYLVDGPMSKAIGLYRGELEQHDYRRVAGAGAYDLYRREVAPAGVRSGPG